jgi:G:T-mismatch repair DNA endonuclease (very short patch repair protein)
MITKFTNEIYYNNKMLIEKNKSGKFVHWMMDDGSSVTTSELTGSPVLIKCHICKEMKSVNFYVGKNGLTNRVYSCMTCNKLANKNPFYNKKHTDNFKKRLSEERKGKWNVGKDNPMSGISNWKNFDKKRLTIIKSKISKACSGENNGFYGKEHCLKTKEILAEKSKQYMIKHPEHLKKMMEASFKRQSCGFKSSIEKTVEKELSTRDIKFKYSKILHRKYQYDFIIEENILLEVHGDYWHANPLYYGNENGKRKMNERQKYKIEQDAKKKRFAEEYGFQIFYIWETDIKYKKFDVVDLIEEKIKRNIHYE